MPKLQRTLRVALRVFLITLGVAVLLLVASGLWLRHHLGQSLARLDGEIEIAGLVADVTIERDELGVPTIRGENRSDVARGLGFLHGQERFFQIDLIRRKAAGELAELVGAAALPLDRRVRIHRFRARARAIVAAMEDADRQLLDAYVEGVNAGLDALDAPPFEYLVLGTEPKPWSGEDSLLAGYAMYLDLQGNGGHRESVYGLAHDLLPPALYEFLAARGTEWDAPIDGEMLATPAIPAPEDFDLRALGATELEVARRDAPEKMSGPDLQPTVIERDAGIGSNNWAVAGAHTTHGGPLLAPDLHLGPAVPNLWYRASLPFPAPTPPGRERRVTGVTLPGVSAVMAGSNGDVAWGFTNSYGDWTDLVILEADPEDPDAYLTPDGPKRFERHQEVLRTADGGEEVLEVVETIWGPVWDTDHRGRQRALRWVAHDDRAVNFTVQWLESTSNLEEAMTVANRAGTPAQNFTVADRHGRVGWTIMGPMPRRFGHDGWLPSSWADGSRGWDGWLWPEEYPRVIDPESGRIWTANSRIVGGSMYELLGDGGYDIGARGKQIRDGLMAVERAGENDLLAIQLDDRALFLERWRELLLEVLTPEATAADPRRAELRRLALTWNGRASIDSAAYRLVRAFRLELRDQVFEALTARIKDVDDGFRYTRLGQKEGPLWQLASTRPAHLLNPRFDDWQAQFLAAVDAILDDLLEGGGELAERTWGARNQVRVRHPLSRFMSFASRWLDMPTMPLPGDNNMPRVQGTTFGASERMVVSPGREEEGFFHMPTGQSGHPLSPHYGNGHRAWMEGQPTSFLTGATVHTVILKRR